MIYKNFNVAPGMSQDLYFTVRDETGLRMDLSEDYTFRLEITDSNYTLRGLLTTAYTAGLATGELGFNLSPQAGLDIVAPTGEAGNFEYRLVLISSVVGVQPLVAAKGWLNFSAAVYNPLSIPGSNEYILPDGTIYTSVPVTMTPDEWYALSGNWRLVVSPTGLVSLDSRDLAGGVTINSHRLANDGPVDITWTPDMTGKTAIRMHVVQGACTVKYFP